MPLKKPIDIAMALLPGGVDSLMKSIDEHPELQGLEKDKYKRLALAELLIMGNTGRRGGPAEVAVAAFQMADISVEELVIEAKVAVQKIPPQPMVH